MIVMHGGTYLAFKADPVVADRAAVYAQRAVLVLLALFAICGIYVGHVIEGYQITSDLAHGGPSNPC
jgi:cytochrome bd ubiquinol oxidase subunit II